MAKALLRTLVLLCGFGFLNFANATPKAFPPIPRDFVFNDSTLISKTEELNLSRHLEQFQKKTGYSLAIALFSSLGDEDIDDYSNRLYRHWCGKDDKSCAGLLIVVAEKEHRYRTEIGYGLEGRITDVLASRAQAQLLRPKLRENRSYEGLSLLIDRYSEILSSDGEARGEAGATYKTDRPNVRGNLPIIILFIIVFVFIKILSTARSLVGGHGIKKRRQGWWMGGGDGWGGGGFGGGGGGGFGGFSGGSSGSSGGGGSSGSW